MIVVCGEALIDRIHNGDGTQRAVPGGGPFNTARALARLEVPTAFLGRLSEDVFGRQMAGLLVSEGASLELASIGPEPTTIAIADVDSEGFAEYQFLVEGTSAPNLTVDMLPEQLGPEVNALYVGTLGLVLEPMASTLAELMKREHGRRLIVLDPNIRAGLIPDSEYRERLQTAISHSTIVKASQADLAWICPGLDYELAAAQILRDGVSMVVVTLGARGAYGAHRDARIQVAAPQVDVVDTIGAGDAFGAALVAWLHDHGAIRPDLSLEEAEIKAALDYACLAGALTCTRAGADPPWKGRCRPRDSQDAHLGGKVRGRCTVGGMPRRKRKAVGPQPTAKPQTSDQAPGEEVVQVNDQYTGGGPAPESEPSQPSEHAQHQTGG